MLKEIRFDHRTLQLPIIQGGMGVGVSLSSLAGHVMKEGAMGVISAAHPGYRRPDFRKDSIAANCAAIHEECARARAISEGNGLLGINIMVASTDYDTYVRAAIDAGVDAIISGAGLPLHLPKLTKDSDVLLAPIVSSARAAHLILRTWDKHYQTCPDFIVIEGSEAGGHLGFSREELEEGRCQPLDAIVREVLGLLAPYEERYQKKIRVFAAGGIFDGNDIARMLRLGADGVQMATRFIATYECDAADSFKQAVLQCTKEDIRLIKSPAGLPGRALNTRFIRRVEGQTICMNDCLRCMKPCDPSHTPYCISEALITSVSRDAQDGVVFVGANAWRIDSLLHVSQLLTQLKEEANASLKEN